MLIKLIQKVTDLLKKELFVSLLMILIVGFGVGYYFSNKRKPDGCVLGLTKETKDEDQITVDIAGAVQKPGVYSLKTSSRVGDLISVAGGAKGQASTTWVSKKLNLSEKLKDASKIYIPFDWEIYEPEKYELSKVEGTASSNTVVSKTSPSDEEDNTSNQTNNGKVNINTALSSELDALPGIGPSFAERIIAGRPYKDAAEFETKSGLWKSTIEGIKDLITF